MSAIQSVQYCVQGTFHSVMAVSCTCIATSMVNGHKNLCSCRIGITVGFLAYVCKYMCYLSLVTLPCMKEHHSLYSSMMPAALGEGERLYNIFGSDKDTRVVQKMCVALPCCKWMLQL